MEPTVVETDLLIAGAGPAGLYGAYYAGFRDLHVTLVDSLTEPGGQIAALYPVKQIYDVAGFPAVKGQTLVDALVEQAAQYSPTYLLGHRAETLTDTGEGLEVATHEGTLIRAGALVITGGIGTFTPRKLPGADDYEARGLEYFVRDFTPYADRDVLIVGGGDSAFDWAHNLESVSSSVTLIHRRDRFRAHERTVRDVFASSVDVRTFTEVTEIRGDDWVEEVEVEHTQSGERDQLKVQQVIAALGFTASLGPISTWDLELDRRKVLVDTRMQTNRDRVFAAGDITSYPGKVELISVGFGEAATAVNNAVVRMNPNAKLFPGHSSEM
ncbi:NAD(P)/FAD-dependent oxidoreductase [Egibacter rhizosphaerae]|uniref:Ferredoxin--NADP reductase n=1 Tax=Egibacter rhizosphaerae TaxID=1670831 RepID=A0A411YD23_9ACTN|nr:NAD(P)/FAD-dependent oxidoreductase [Egibacter rhizosphaerae]QBI19143.1 NAD(P)/FAD-dependent oxidoreductase [Egibacter rhizosphaerae]